MELKLALAQTGLTWTLNDNRIYKVGNKSDCNILLTSVNIISEFCLEFSYDFSEAKWNVRELESANCTLINNQLIGHEKIQIQGQTSIIVADGMVLVATPIFWESTDNIFLANQTNSLVTSTRLLSGYAYLKGIISGFELLSYLRSYPYKAKTPSSSLDLKQISTHAVQSVLICLLFAIAVFSISIIQFLIFKFFGFQGYSKIAIIILAMIAALATAYELIYLRWFLARKFLKKNYKPKIRLKFINFLQPTVEYFKQRFLETDTVQNIITFEDSNPFVGYGELIPTSSWTVPINRKLVNQDSEEPQNTIKEIPTYEFYQAVEQEIKRLNLPKLQQFSQLFVDGFELETDSKIISHPTTNPGTMSLDDPLLWTHEPSPSGSKQRAYRLYQYADVERDYILSHFLRFYNAGAITFVESNAYILTGIDRQRFSLTSTLDDDQLSRFIKMLIAVFVLFPGIYVAVALWYIGIFIFNVVSWFFSDIKQRRAAEFQEEYNYGVSQTLREYVSEPLNLNQKRNLTRIFGNKNRGFTLNRTVKSVLSNPILLILLILLAPILIPIGLLLILINFILNRYRTLERDFNINFDYYGTQDAFLYWKAIQDAIFAGTMKVLKRHGIDTSKFEETVATIVNNGVLVTAATITNSQIAGGVSSTNTQTQERLK